MQTAITVIDRAATSGQRITVDVRWKEGCAWIFGAIEGAFGNGYIGYGRLPAPILQGGKEIVAKVRACGNVAIGITETEALAIDDAIAAIKREWAQTTDGLLAQRRELLRNLRIAGECDREDRDAAWSREDAHGAVRQDAAGHIAAAEQALQQFDATHPEIAAAWDDRRESRRAAQLDNQINYQGA